MLTTVLGKKSWLFAIGSDYYLPLTTQVIFQIKSLTDDLNLNEI